MWGRIEPTEDPHQQNATDTGAECPAGSLIEVDDGNGALLRLELPDKPSLE